MTVIEVTAEVTLQFDTDEGLIANADEAVDEVFFLLASGNLNPKDYTIGWKEIEE